MGGTARTLCALAFFLSGASALTYEILWQRQMFLIFGASAPATTAILTAIFLGIAIGSQLAVPFVRRGNPFWLYACLEAVMGLWGLLVPTVLGIADHIYVSAVASLGEGHFLQGPLRFVLAIAPLLPATLAMGGTIPVMIRCVASTSSPAAWAYGVNLFGAVAGALLTGFFWLKHLGISDTRFVAFSFNVVAMLIALRLATQPELALRRPKIAAGAAEQFPLRRGLLGAMYFVAGFVALGMEVVWLRFLGIVNTNSATTFTLTLTLYLLGMGIGSLAVYRVLRKFLSPRMTFSMANGGAALGALLTFPVVYWAAAINQERIVLPSMAGELTLADVYVTETWIITALVLLPAIFMGMAYPAVCESVDATAADRDQWVGRAYFLGTLGSVAGILLVAMWLIPRMGLHGAFGLLVVLSTVLCFNSATPGGWRLRGGLLAACFAMVVAASWIALDARPVLRETIAVRDGGRWMEAAVSDRADLISELTSVRDGASATVMIKRPVGGQDHLVYVDDQLVASTNLEAKVDSLMLAHLPLMLHEAPRNALTVGFGTGGTSAAMIAHEVDTYCVEIEPEVPKTAHLMPTQNFNVLDEPRFTLILNDARDHLHAGQRKYDVIATDVTNLQYKQNGNLYTVEYFDLMHQKLNPGGIACAWIPMAAIDLDELRILMRSFGRVFPHATLWYMNHTHTNFGILIGTPDSLAIDYRRLEAGFAIERIANNLRLVGMVHPLQFVHCLHLDEDGYRAFCGDAAFHTDDRPILEFSSPMSFYQYHETFHENLDATLRLRPNDFRSFVQNVPDGLDAEFEKHQVASENFCRVILTFYDYLIHRKRAEVGEATEALKDAIDFARSGMIAWPDDRTREEFYTTFFADAQRWLQSTY